MVSLTRRHEQVAADLARVHGRIADACADSGRHAGEVTLVVVTKFFPAADVRILADLGVSDVGENRHQEAEAKAVECEDLALRWHFIGGLQSNKAAAVTGYADVVQSLDRRKLLGPLGRGAQQHDKTLDVLVQMSLDPPGAVHRSGAPADDVLDLADGVAGTEGLRLRGLMAVAPLRADPAAAFDLVAAMHAELRAQHPEATWLSAGMSGDLEAAVKHGATHVRIGSAVLGSRPRVE